MLVVIATLLALILIVLWVGADGLTGLVELIFGAVGICLALAIFIYWWVPLLSDVAGRSWEWYLVGYGLAVLLYKLIVGVLSRVDWPSAYTIGKWVARPRCVKWLQNASDRLPTSFFNAGSTRFLVISLGFARRLCIAIGLLICAAMFFATVLAFIYGLRNGEVWQSGVLAWASLLLGLTGYGWGIRFCWRGLSC